MIETTLTVKHKVGLHARPAAAFVKAATGFQSKISITNLTRNSAPVDAKSILSVLQIAVAQNHTIRLTAEGADEEVALTTLKQLIEVNFGEHD